MLRQRTGVTALIAAVVLVLAGAAFAENYHYARTASEDALAASYLLKKADFPASLKLTGGRTKPDESGNTDTCDGKQAKLSDLVVTGDAETKFSNAKSGIIELDSEVQTLQTAAMVQTDLKRNLPFLTQRCFAQTAKQEHIRLARPVQVRVTKQCLCDEIVTTVFEMKTANPKLNVIWLVSDIADGRLEASVTTAIGRSTSDTHIADSVALGLHTRALQTLLARLSQHA